MSASEGRERSSSLRRDLQNGVRNLRSELARGDVPADATAAFEARLSHLEATIARFQEDTERRLELLSRSVAQLTKVLQRGPDEEEAAPPDDPGDALVLEGIVQRVESDDSDGDGAPGNAAPKALPPPRAGDSKAYLLSQVKLGRLFQITHFCSIEEAMVAILGGDGAYRHTLRFQSGKRLQDMPLDANSIQETVREYLTPNSARDIVNKAKQLKASVGELRRKSKQSMHRAALLWKTTNLRGETRKPFDAHKNEPHKGELFVKEAFRHDVTFAKTCLLPDSGLNFKSRDTLLACLVLAYIESLKDSVPEFAATMGRESKITPGALAAILHEADTMCRPASRPAHSRSTTEWHARRAHLYHTYVVPTFSTQLAARLFIAKEEVLSWLPGVGPVPQWALESDCGGAVSDGPQHRAARSERGRSDAGGGRERWPMADVARSSARTDRLPRRESPRGSRRRDSPPRKRRHADSRGGSRERPAATEVSTKRPRREETAANTPSRVARRRQRRRLAAPRHRSERRADAPGERVPRGAREGVGRRAAEEGGGVSRCVRRRGGCAGGREGAHRRPRRRRAQLRFGRADAGHRARAGRGGGCGRRGGGEGWRGGCGGGVVVAGHRRRGGVGAVLSGGRRRRRAAAAADSNESRQKEGGGGVKSISTLCL
ncbi:unnamed protein product [Pedinophyceae sp. YPF-701]|nr:unnamed protein product [Pedinophyceae sp. YPF-701]